jgi:glycosyltransferase involved in cell wall biosynthesis
MLLSRATAVQAGRAGTSFLFEPTSAAKPLHGLTIAHLGHFDPDYARNRNLAKALRRAGATVVDIADRRAFPARTPRLAHAGVRAHADMILVGFPGQSDVPLAKLVALGRRAPVVLDALTSVWETNVIDRRSVPTRSLRAYRYRLTDRVACSLADAVLADTDAHIAWFRGAFGIPAGKLHRVWVGADDEVMTRCRSRQTDGAFTVFFYGSFIPLHGIEHIIGAAERLHGRDADIRFILCGGGQTLGAMRDLAASRRIANVDFIGRRPLPELHRLMCQSDVCLGIFGTGPKARVVIPNKVFDGLACARPVITGDTPAAREALTHGRNIVLCRSGDPDALADAVARLKADAEGRSRIAAAGHELFKRRFSLDALAAEVARIVLDLLAAR